MNVYLVLGTTDVPVLLAIYTVPGTLLEVNINDTCIRLQALAVARDMWRRCCLFFCVDFVCALLCPHLIPQRYMHT